MKKNGKEPRKPAESLGSGCILAVALRPDPDHRSCTPVEIRIVDGRVVEAAPIHPESEEISYSLARATGRLQEIHERASVESWPPDFASYELAGAALQRLQRPVTMKLSDGLPDKPPVPDGVPELVAKEFSRRYPMWRKSVGPVLTTAGAEQLECRETLTSWKWAALRRDGSAVSTLSVQKEAV